MKKRILKGIVCLMLIGGAASPAPAQTVNILFTGQVTEVSAPLLEGVTVGSTITVRVSVDLAYLPKDSEPDPDRSFFVYSGLRQPGYVFEIDTGFETITLDSVNAATGVGIVPGISLTQAGDSDIFDMAARDEGNPYGALLVFRDDVAPFELLTGDYFPEDANLAGGVDYGVFIWSDFIHTNAVVATMTSAAMSFEYDPPTVFLRYRVRVSDLRPHIKRALTAALHAADRAYARDQCAAGVRYLRHFQRMVRSLVGADTVLGEHLLRGAEDVIDFGCVQQKRGGGK
jgi:hypothetical protein